MITSSPNDEMWMSRAIRLAMNGRGTVEPNPSVGCVLVKNNRIIGEGFTRPFGGAHAEPTALAACTESAEGATAYVTLEPCCHLDKKTPPCVPKLIAARIARVVIGCIDPNPKVAGNGVRQLREAGIHVDLGVLGNEARQLIAPFIAAVEHHRPYVTLKWAQTADCKIAGPGGRRLAITNAASNAAVHALRSRCDAICVGINTVLSDDPLLTARGDQQTKRSLLRIVLDTHLRFPADCRLARTPSDGPVIIFTTPGQSEGYPRSAAPDPASPPHVRTISIPPDDTGRPSLPAMLHKLFALGVTHLLVEPGPTLAHSFLAQNLADRLWVFESPQRIDDPTAPAAAASPYPPAALIVLDGDVLTESLNPSSATFAANVPSADMVLLSG